MAVTGVIGILLRASKQNEIEMRSALDNLIEKGFWISDELYSRVLDQ